MARFCNAVYAWMVERVEDPDEFEYHLHKPIPGMMVSDDVVQQEMDAFKTLMGGAL